MAERALLAEIRPCQEELGQRIGARGIKVARRRPMAVVPIPTEVGDFARALGTTPLDPVDVASIEPRATHRNPKRRYKTRMRMPSKLDPHPATIEGWLATEPQITALAIVHRLAAIDPDTFGDKQHPVVQRLPKALRSKSMERVIAETAPGKNEAGTHDTGIGGPAVGLRPPSGPANTDVAPTASSAIDPDGLR